MISHNSDDKFIFSERDLFISRLGCGNLKLAPGMFEALTISQWSCSE